VEYAVDLLIHIRDQFNHHIMFGLAALLLAGYGMGKLAERFNLPAITGFIVAGLLLGESVTGVVHEHISHYLTNISELALGIIALTIGSEFSWAKLKRLGWRIIVITVCQLLMAFVAVTGGLLCIGLSWTEALLLGAIATATAPAATVAIVQSLRVRGEFVDYLYGIVALDDAGCVIVFSIVFAVVSVMAGGGGGSGMGAIVAHGFAEVGLSLLVGVIGGVVMHFLTFRQRRKNQLMILSMAVLLMVTAVAISLKVSPLLANMMMGATVVNISHRNVRVLDTLQPLTPPVYAAFFAIAGTELDLGAVANGTILLVGVVYVLLRGAGKYFGVWSGALLTGAPLNVKNYLGLCMLPQAGVAIGLVLFIETSPVVTGGQGFSPHTLNLLTSVVLFGVFVNELTGPPLSKVGLQKGALRTRSQRDAKR
jgi:Kef-type K+ transport system membrane component KefB